MVFLVAGDVYFTVYSSGCTLYSVKTLNCKIIVIPKTYFTVDINGYPSYYIIYDEPNPNVATFYLFSSPTIIYL